MSGIDTVLQYLQAVPAWYLATSVDDQPLSATAACGS